MLAPTELHEWQRRWAAMLTTGTIPTEFYAQIPSSHDATTRRLSIYRQSFFIAKLSALKTIFKATVVLLGDEMFDVLAARFLKTHQSITPDTHDVGANFPAFIRAGNIMPLYASDLAQFEWCWHSVFHGPSQPKLAREVLMHTAKTQQTALLLVTTPGICILLSPYLLADKWQQLIEFSTCAWSAPHVLQASYCFALVQQENEVHVYRVPREVGGLLEACRQPLTLETLVDTHPDVEAWLPDLLDQGLLSLASPVKLP